MQTRGADQHTSQKLSEDGGELEANQNFSQRSRRHENQHEAANPNQGSRHLEIVGRQFSQQRHENGRHRSSEHRNRHVFSAGP